MERHKLNNREYFNSVAYTWDETVKHDKNKIESILKIVGIGKDDSVLDVGTGTGVLVPFLHTLVGGKGKITAIDVSENMISVAKSKFHMDNVEFIVGDVLHAGFDADSFDCIVCYSMFPHFDDKKAAVIKLSSYLRSGGKLAVAHSQSRDAINGLHRDLTGDVSKDRLPSADKIAQYFKEAGITVVSVTDNNDMFIVVGVKQ